jgi:hypothetical protein
MRLNSITSYKQKDTGQYISTPMCGGMDYAQMSQAEVFFSLFSFVACLPIACCVLLAALLPFADFDNHFLSHFRQFLPFCSEI